MVERTNKSIKGLLRQHAGSRPDTWDETLPLVRLTLNTVKHSTTGITPYRAWFSRCDEATLPIDLFTGRRPEHKYFECLQGYVTNQVKVCHEVHKMVRHYTGQRMKVQARSRLRSGLRIRKYKPGDMVWRYYPPHKADKFNPNVWIGPYKVLDVDDTSHLVKIEIHSLGQGGALKPTWVHTSNIKPVVYTRSGKLFEMQNPGIHLTGPGTAVPQRCGA